MLLKRRQISHRDGGSDTAALHADAYIAWSLLFAQRPQEVAKDPLRYVPTLPPRLFIREAEMNAMINAHIDCIFG
jgi:hypothetical protein